MGGTGYPTGPPTCGSEGDPTCQVWITSMSQTPPLVVFSFWILVFAAVVSFQLYRAWYAKKHPSPSVFMGGLAKGEKARALRTKESTIDDDVEVGGGAEPEVVVPELRFTGYRTVVAGELCWWLLILTSLHWIGLYVLVLVDEYWACQVTGIDNTCFYGTYFIFGSYDQNGTVLFTIWCISVVWFTALVVFKREVHNWFRMPCDLPRAHVLHVWAQDQQEILSVTASRVVHFVRKLKDKCNVFRPDRKGHGETVVVKGTRVGTRHVSFRGQRYLIAKDGSLHLARIEVGHTCADFFKASVKETRTMPVRSLIVVTAKLKYSSNSGNGSPTFVVEREIFLGSMKTWPVKPAESATATFSDLQEISESILSEGLSSQEAQARYNKVGPNEVPFKAEKLWVSAAEELFTFFKVYQFLIYAIWLWFSYLFVGALLLCVVLTAASISIINRRRAQLAIAKLTEYESFVEVKRDGTWRNVDSKVLVPGDVVKVKSDWKLPCDLLILQGVCVCNESNLTGEAMPVQKYKAADVAEVYEADGPSGARHTLFSGTQVLQAGTAGGSSTEVLAIVTATGMSTSKGRLLSTILFPQKMVFKYDEELPIVVGLMLSYAVLCFTLTLIFQYRTGQQSTWITKWSNCIFTISQIASPLLPVALEIGQIYAAGRLKNRGVYCLNAKRIAIAGKIQVFCFDKTGTLTNDGLDFVGIQGTKNTVNNRFQFCLTQSPSEQDLIDKVILLGMATCHAVTKFGAQFVGNEVEIKMFSSLGWDLTEGGTAAQQYPTVFNTSGDVYYIVRRNEFEHARATMSVVVQDHTGELHVYCKGSFEKIQELSVDASLPQDYLQTAKAHALDGCYVLGLGYKSLGKDLSLDVVKKLSQDDLETDLTFLSLLLFRNELKPDSRNAIEGLRKGNVRPLMITGDNAQCGCYIAKECGMVTANVEVLLAEINHEGSLIWQTIVTTVLGNKDQALSTIDMWKTHQKQLEGGLIELAVTGKAFNELCRTGKMQELLLYTRLFARFTPKDKVQVINMHRDIGLVVGMCGDGGNDCGALRSAHVGLALSEAEASVVSPFTSKAKSISSAIDLVREGKAALHTSFACFKFLIMYGLSFSILKLTQNWYGFVACQMDFFFIDGVAVLILGYTMNLSNPVKTLNKDQPTSSLLGAQNVASLLGMWSINLLFVIGALSFMTAQSDYVKWPAKLSHGKDWWTLGDNWESTINFFTVYFQFIAASIVFSFGSSFRQNFFQNYLLVGSYASIFIVVSLALVLPHSSFTHLWHVASEEYNSPNAISPVWVTYQQHGGAPSAAMSTSFRLCFWFLLLANFIVVALWQKVVVEGLVAKMACSRFSSTWKLHL